jgi:hypothetical protein
VRQDLCTLRATRRVFAGAYPDAHESDLGAGGLHSEIYAPGVVGETPASHSYLMKKPGYYLAEEGILRGCVKNWIWRLTIVSIDLDYGSRG